MSGGYDTLDLEPGPVTVVRLNRPASSNALNTREELVACFEALAIDAGAVGCVVLTGAGEKAFCASQAVESAGGCRCR